MSLRSILTVESLSFLCTMLWMMTLSLSTTVSTEELFQFIRWASLLQASFRSVFHGRHSLLFIFASPLLSVFPGRIALGVADSRTLQTSSSFKGGKHKKQLVISMSPLRGTMALQRICNTENLQERPLSFIYLFCAIPRWRWRNLTHSLLRNLCSQKLERRVSSSSTIGFFRIVSVTLGQKYRRRRCA